MRKDDFTGVQMHCVVCQNPIPHDRKKDAVTCSKQCTKARRDYFRSRVDQTSCRYCNRPSTPEERVLFSRWRKWLKTHTEDSTEGIDKLLPQKPEDAEAEAEADESLGTVPNAEKEDSK